jgi:hypothetical protein
MPPRPQRAWRASDAGLEQLREGLRLAVLSEERENAWEKPVKKINGTNT